MPPVSGTLPSLINGVSQQPNQARLPSQMEAVEDCWGDIVEGLGKRPHSSHIAQLSTTHLGHLTNTFGQFVNLGTYGWKFVVVSNGALRLFDADDGTEHTIEVLPITGADPRTVIGSTPVAEAFKALSTGNEMLLLNKTVPVTNVADLEPLRYALVDRWMCHLKAGNYSNDYSIVVTVNDGVTSTDYTALKTTSVDDPDDIKTTGIMSDLYTALASALTSTAVVVELKDSTMALTYDRAANGGFMTVHTYDSNGNVDLIPVGPSIQRISDLPQVAKQDFKVKVIGENASLSQPYYARFQLTDTTDAGVTFGNGTWVESYGDIGVKGGGGDKDRFRTLGDMPYRLYYDVATSKWTLKAAEWGIRTAGDSLSAPFPEFASGMDTYNVGTDTYSQRTINDIFLFKNRLGIVADNTLSFSEFDDIFTFFPATVTAILDTAPISVVARNTGVTEIHKGVPFEGGLYLYTDGGQFDLGDVELLTPKTVALNPIADYKTDPLADPIGLGKSIFFTEAKGNFAGVQELYVDSNNGVVEASKVTSRVTKYIPLRIKALTGGTLEDCLFALSTETGPYLYVYKFHWVGDQKVQAMWHRWCLDASKLNSNVIAFTMIGNALHYVVQRVTDGDTAFGCTLEKISLSQGTVDEDGTFLTHLDRRITEADCSVSYDALSDLTTWDLPYESTSDLAIYVRTAVTDWPRGRRITSSVVGSNLVATGDFSDHEVYIGVPYRSSWKPSKFFHKKQTPQGEVPVITGRTQIKHLKLGYKDAGTFRVVVTPKYRDSQTITFEPTTDQSQAGVIEFRDGTFNVPVGCRNLDLEIEVVNDSPFQARFISAEWIGIHEELN